MKPIATDVTDSTTRMAEMVTAQMDKPGFAIDAYFYRSHVIYQTELEQIVFKSWLYAGHVSQIPDSGDYFLFELGEDSIIVSRDDKGKVQAMHNICRHRGARVCEDMSGNRGSFVCPYHGWVYNIDGSLRAARDMEMLEDFSSDNYGLKPVRLEVFQGLMFINCDPDAADFRGPLEKMTVQLGAYDLANAKVADSKLYAVEANWKLCLENYLECYHCATSHRSYARIHTLKALAHKVKPINEAMWARADEVTGVPGIADAFYAYYGLASGFGACAYHSRYALYEGYLTGSEDGKPLAPLMGNMQGYDGGAGDFQMGPLSFMLNYPDHCVLYRFIPRGITQTDMEIVWFVNGDAEEGVDYDKGKLTWLWHSTAREDEFIIRRNSAGVNSHFFEPGPYHPEFEQMSMSFIKWYLDTLHRVSRP
jgi:Rieske 2Fe-2S family protein